MRQRPIDRIIDKRQKTFILDGLVKNVYDDNTADVEFGGVTRRIVNASGLKLTRLAPVIVSQLYGQTNMAFISGLSPRYVTQPIDVWI